MLRVVWVCLPSPKKTRPLVLLPSPKKARTGGVGRGAAVAVVAVARTAGEMAQRTTGPFCVYGTGSSRRNGTNGPCILRTVWGLYWMEYELEHMIRE